MIIDYPITNFKISRKLFKIILLLLFFSIPMCKAQDTSVVISKNMFDKTNQQILLSTKDGWLFKPGNDTSWAKKEIDIAGWEKLKPTQLSTKYADKNGRVECWFRMKIKIDSSFEDNHLGLEQVPGQQLTFILMVTYIFFREYWE